MPTVSAQLHAAGNALRSGDREAGWRLLEPTLAFPAGAEMSDAEFAQALGMLTLIRGDSLGEPATTALTTARITPTDAEALYRASQYLLAEDLPGLAVTALARANSLAPDVPALVNELVRALEASGLEHHAYLILQDAFAARRQNWTTRYLYVFHAIMAGRMIEARQGFGDLGEPSDKATQLMHDRLINFLRRHKLAGAATALDDGDLRGWHYVMTGGLLSHLSAHECNSGMNGRYGSSTDRDVLIHEGVLRAVAILQAWGTRPGQLIYSNDRSSEILANVWNQRLGIPIRAFRPADAASPGDTSTTGLFVAYDLAQADPDFLHCAELRRPGQLVVSHASCWTTAAAFTSDISTYQYESNVSPWGTTTNDPEHEAGDLTTPAVSIAARIAASTVPSDALADLKALSTLAETVGLPPTTGYRDRFFVGSPVRSSRIN